MAELAKMGVEFPDWQREKPTKELRYRLVRWQSLDLLSMAKKRDEMHPLGRTPLAKQTLTDLYGRVCRQFSSVSHFGMYSMRLVGLFPAPSGELVLAPDPWWPSFLCAYTALFNLVQCYEAAVAVHGAEEVSAFDALFTEWETSSSRLTAPERPLSV